jgi:hypothetical protein
MLGRASPEPLRTAKLARKFKPRWRLSFAPGVMTTEIEPRQ